MRTYEDIQDVGEEDFQTLVWKQKLKSNELVVNLIQKIFSNTSFFPHIKPEMMKSLILVSAQFNKQCKDHGIDGLKLLNGKIPVPDWLKSEMEYTMF